MRRLALAAVLAVLAAGAGAHPAPNSRLELTFGNGEVRAEYWVPVSELAYARTADPRGGFADYLLRHLAAESPGGAPWRVRVAAVRQEGDPDLQSLEAATELRPQAAEVHLVLDHEVQHLGRHFIADIDAHLRITLPKLPQDLWQNIGAISIAGRQGYMPPQALTERRNIGPGRLQAGQDRLRVLVQEFPCWRETQSRAMAYQERLTAAGYGPITTEIAPAPEFYFAEDYHQQYLAKNPGGYCGHGGTGVACPTGLSLKS